MSTNSLMQLAGFHCLKDAFQPYASGLFLRKAEASVKLNAEVTLPLVEKNHFFIVNTPSY
jgi:hypothetical protein